MEEAQGTNKVGGEMVEIPGGGPGGSLGDGGRKIIELADAE